MKGFPLRFLTLAIAGLGILGIPALAQDPGVPQTTFISAPAHTFVDVTLTVTNFDLTTAATGVYFTFTQPKGVKLVLDGGGICNSQHQAQGARLITCTLGDIAALGSASVTLQFSDGVGQSNFMYTVGANGDLNPDNNIGSIILNFS